MFPSNPPNSSVEAMDVAAMVAGYELEPADLSDTHEMELMSVLSQNDVANILKLLDEHGDQGLLPAGQTLKTDLACTEKYELQSVDTVRPTPTYSPVIPLFVQQEDLDAQTFFSTSDLDGSKLADATSPPYHLQLSPASSLSAQPTYSASPLRLTARTGSDASALSGISFDFQDSSVLPEVRGSPEPTGDQTVPLRRVDGLVHRPSDWKLTDADSRTAACRIKTERLSVTESTSCTAIRSRLSSDVTTSARQYSRHETPKHALTTKKERRREQNRRAATKCRNKRRQEYEQLKVNQAKVVNENERLQAELSALRVRYSQLQTELQRHQTYCGLQPLSR